MPVEEFFTGCRRAVTALAAAVDELDNAAPADDIIATAADRGLFRPEEEAALLSWFGRFLTLRSGLWEVIGDVSHPVGGRMDKIQDTDGWRCFVLGYTSACLIVRLDRMLLEEVARNPVTQRKLNEGSELHRIPRKQYTAIFESFTNPGKAHMMEQAMRLARDQRRRLDAMSEDPIVGDFVTHLREREKVLEPSRRRYLSLLMNYLVHAFRRRGASARQQAVFAVLETGGRVASELHDQWTPCRIDDRLRDRLDALLHPGDVLITRHERALTNLFLPGFWPHAALYIGSEDDRRHMNVTLDEDRATRWSGDRRVLEALKDGVLFRPLEQTLAVDAVAVIRPQLDQADLARGLSRIAEHEGKLYNFDFDFFRSDRLVCTEVVYRAFDGLGPIRIPLQDRSGRPTLSAEDLLDLAFAGLGFEPVAVYGGPSCPDSLVEGEEARDAISPANRVSPAAIADRGADPDRPTGEEDPAISTGDLRSAAESSDPQSTSQTTGSPDPRITRVLLAAGALLAVINLAVLGVLWATDTALFTRVMAVLGAAYVGGRMAGILAGLELGLGALWTSMVIILLNTGWLLLVLPLFQKVTQQLNPPKLLASFFRGAKNRARSQTQRMRNYGTLGLVLFIWLPFPFSGAFVGALIGLLMGISLVRLVPIVLLTMWVGVFTWTWGIDYLFLFTGTAGHVIAWVLTGAFLVWSAVIRFRESRETGAE